MDSRSAAHRTPGRRPIRSIGPTPRWRRSRRPGRCSTESDTLPRQARVRPHALRPAAPAHSASGAEHRLWQYGRLGGGRRRCGPATLFFKPRARGHRQPCPDRDRIAKARSWFHVATQTATFPRGDIYLHVRRWRVAQLRQYRRARHQQWIADMGREFAMADRAASGHPWPRPSRRCNAAASRYAVALGQVGSDRRVRPVIAGRSCDRVRYRQRLCRVRPDTAMLSHKRS